MKKLDIYLQNARINKAVQFIKPGNKILDIGSGDGPLFSWLEKRKIPFTGIGLDPEVPETRTSNYRILPEKFPNASISGQRFHIITALAVLEHIPENVLGEFAMNCNRHLVTGGKLVITVPSKQVDHILKLLIGLRIIDGMEVDQHHGYDTNQTIPLFKKSGFELLVYKRFQLGLNNLFVFVKKMEV